MPTNSVTALAPRRVAVVTGGTAGIGRDTVQERRRRGNGRGGHERRAAAPRPRVPRPDRRARPLRLRVGDEVAREHPTDRLDVDGYWIPRGWAKEGPVKTQSRIDVPRRGCG